MPEEAAPVPRIVLNLSVFLSALLVIAWLAALFLNPFLKPEAQVAFPEWVVTLVLGATIGGLAARYGGKAR